MSFRVKEDTSKLEKAGEVEDKRLKGSLHRKAVPPPRL
jgi:hypothetical protein